MSRPSNRNAKPRLTVEMLENRITPAFVSFTPLTGLANPFNGIDVGGFSRPALGDVDGDGDLDLVAGGQFGTVLSYRVNRAPVVDQPIPDQTFTGEGVKSYTVPADAFLDLDRDALTYIATQASGAALPSWLTFTPATRTFSGNPSTNDASPLTIRVTATDPDGASVSDDFQLTPSNVSDTPTVGRTQAAVSVNEGSQVTNIGTFDDHDGRASVTLTASLGTVTKDDATGTWNWSYTPADDLPSPATVTITASDSAGLSAVTIFTLSVANVAPTVTISGPASATVGVAYTLTLAAPNDPGADTVTQFVVRWGDGTFDTYATAGAKTHTYSASATYPVTVDLVDDDGTHLSRANPLAVAVSPLVTLTKIDNGLSPQRAMVRSLPLTFSSPVALAAALANLSLAPGVTLSGTLDAAGTTLTVRFAGASIVGGSLADGR